VPEPRRLLAAPAAPDRCWQPDPRAVASSNLTTFADFVAVQHGLPPFERRDLADYRRLHAWSAVSNPADFWTLVWDYVGFVGTRGGPPVDPAGAEWGASGNPSARWFPGAQVNHAENLLAHGSDDAAALIFASEGTSNLETVTYRELRERVAALARVLAAVDGVQAGDCCAGYVANTPDAVVAMLAVTSLGAAWATCSPDFGERGVLDRFSQVRPKVLFVHDCYHYRGKRFDMAPKVNAIAASLPSVARTVVLEYPHQDAPRFHAPLPAMPGAIRLADYLAQHPMSTSSSNGGAMRFYRSGFDLPVYIMFSSGTTGKPKCMVQGCGVTLNHAKESALHFDINARQRVFWFTTTGCSLFLSRFISLYLSLYLSLSLSLYLSRSRSLPLSLASLSRALPPYLSPFLSLPLAPGLSPVYVAGNFLLPACYLLPTCYLLFTINDLLLATSCLPFTLDNSTLISVSPPCSFEFASWMMWQWLVGAALTRGAAAVLYDGAAKEPC